MVLGQRNKPKYYVTVDAAVFTVHEKQLNLLLIKRRNEPFAHMYALPGGYVEEQENLEQAVSRELREETGVKEIFLHQIGAYGNVNRDPRGRTVSVAFIALIDATKIKLNAQTDAETAQWFSLGELPALAFDHETIINDALFKLRQLIGTTDIAFELLPVEFTLTELQLVHEAILGTVLDKRNFRKKIFADDVVIQTSKTKMDGVHRPARLYKFKTVLRK